MGTREILPIDDESEFGKHLMVISTVWILLSVGAGIGLVVFRDVFAGLF